MGETVEPVDADACVLDQLLPRQAESPEACQAPSGHQNGKPLSSTCEVAVMTDIVSGLVSSAAGPVVDACIQATPATVPAGSQTVWIQELAPRETGTGTPAHNFRTALDHEESIRSQFALRLASVQAELRSERNSSAALRTQVVAAHKDLDKLRGERKAFEALRGETAGPLDFASIATQTLAPAPRLDVGVGDEPIDLPNSDESTPRSVPPRPLVPSGPAPGGSGRPRYKALVSTGVAKPAGRGSHRLPSQRQMQVDISEVEKENDRELLEALAAGRFSDTTSGLVGTPKATISTARRF